MDWKTLLSSIKKSENYQKLLMSVEDEYDNFECFPPQEQIFRALDLCDFSQIKVVILGQDPYHDVRQANGLAFSVSNLVKTPPSLRNIFKEMYSDLGIFRQNNELEDWARQGVLLLNSTLTVRAHEANSHKNLGWEFFTDAIISKISEKIENVVFVLWGSFAQKKIPLIDAQKHLIITSAHPSPLSAHRGFLGSKPFSKINDYLISKNSSPILWDDESKTQLF
jgi:uracil-DNA glycosylase